MQTSDFREMPQEERLRHVQGILARYHAAREEARIWKPTKMRKPVIGIRYCPCWMRH